MNQKCSLPAYNPWHWIKKLSDNSENMPMAVTKKKSISQFCTKLCGDFFFCKEKGEGSNAGQFFE